MKRHAVQTDRLLRELVQGNLRALRGRAQGPHRPVAREATVRRDLEFRDHSGIHVDGLRIARKRSLDWVQKAFFNLNAIISLVFMAMVVVEVCIVPRFIAWRLW